MAMLNLPSPKINYLSPFAPLDWHVQPWRDRSLVMLLSGGSGGGKSKLAAEKMHAYLLKYPGAVGLMVRKTLKSANRSCVPTMWKVMGGVRSGVLWNKSENTFTYPNGSILYTGGMQDEEQRESVRSIGGEGGVDLIWVEEATAIVEQDYNELLARLRHTAASWRQIILTTNPDAPGHWINRRLIVGREASVYYSVAADNPYLPDSYFETLNTLTGTQYQRLVLNKWVQSEGAIYDNFSLEPDGNVTEEAEYNPSLPIVWGVDDGYARGGGKGTDSYHPRVFLLCQFTPTGGINVFQEYAACLEVEETSLKHVIELGYPLPEIAYVDSSAAQLKARIHAFGIQTIGATHVVTEGIKNLRRLVCDGNGVRLLKVHPRCVDLINDFQSYEYADSVTAVSGERRPAKLNDHHCFVAGMLVETERGQVAIELLKAGDRVLTRDGYHTIDACGETSVSPVITVKINGTYTLTGTSDHPVYTENRGFIALRELGINDIILVSNSIKDTSPCPRELYQKSSLLSTTESRSGVILNQNAPLIATILNQTASMFAKGLSIFTAKSGNTSAGRFLMGIMSIIKIRTQQTIQSTISNASRRLSTFAFTANSCLTNTKTCYAPAWRLFALSQKSGTPHQRGLSGIASMEKMFGRIANLLRLTVNNVASPMKHFTGETLVFAPTIANRHPAAPLALTTKSANAPVVAKTSPVTNTCQSGIAAVRVQHLSVTSDSTPQTVYNLSVNAVPEYFGNGILLHNCDSLRYASFRLRYNT